MAKYIDADALMKNFCGYDLTKCQKYGNETTEQRDISYSTMMMYEIADEIENMPAADVEPVRHGKWTDPSDDDGGIEWHCSVCGYAIKTLFYPSVIKYCENCGAKLDGGSE